MSSDFEFDDELSGISLEAIEAAEAASLASLNLPPVSAPDPIIIDSSDYEDTTFNFDEEDLQQLDKEIEDQYAGKKPIVGPSRPRPRNPIQTTLFGEVATTSNTHKAPQTGLQRTTSSSIHPLTQRSRQTKVWDQTAFSATGKLLRKNKSKGKNGGQDSDAEADEPVEFEQFPAPFISIGPPPPMKLEPDLDAAETWIYPLNKPKRDYQFNIVKRCLFDNTLVSLPTGLGKTFIAGVVMLNYYRWFPEGKIIFVAPTKPLVVQQIEACHESSGIPGRNAAIITGSIPPAKRSQTWHLKRVFFATAQTVSNDIVNETCDARDIVLLIVDEAHRSSGDSAYAQLVRLIMSRNPYFRILALTATPANKPDAIQPIVDALHISRIEIRSESAIDIQSFLHTKEIKTHTIEMNEVMLAIQEPLVEIMATFRSKAMGNIPIHMNLARIHPYFIHAKLQELAGNNWPAFNVLKPMWYCATALSYLVKVSLSKFASYWEGLCEGNGDLEDEILDFDDGDPKWKKPKKKAGPSSNQLRYLKALRQHSKFTQVTQALTAAKSSNFVHPKLEKTRDLLIQYFGQHMPDKDGKADSTRAMIFSRYRESVDEIVAGIADMNPLIRASRFVGQGTDTKGGRGMTQNEQGEVIKNFKEGVFNVIVATSIGEEGLDIGEVDFVICYDAEKSPIQMLQRIGRTGRKRNGYVHVLLAEGREEMNLDKAKDAYKHIQKSIENCELELFSDVHRMLPEHKHPICVEKVMEIKPYSHEEKEILWEDGSPIKGTRKRKRLAAEIPEGAAKGFVKASALKSKAPKKRKVAEPKDFDQAGEDDSDDKEIEAGIVLRRAASTSEPISKTKSKGTGLRKTKTMGDSTKKAAKPRTKKGKKADKSSELILDEEGASRNTAINDNTSITRSLTLAADSGLCGLSTIEILSSPEISLASLPPSKLPTHKPTFKSRKRSPSPEVPSSPKPRRKIPRISGPVQRSATPEPAPSTDQNPDDDVGWLLDDDDDDACIEILSSSSDAPATRPATPISVKSSSRKSFSFHDENSFSADLSPCLARGGRLLKRTPSEQMPPPITLPTHISLASASPSSPELSFPIKRRRILDKTIDSSVEFSSPLGQQPLNRLRYARDGSGPRTVGAPDEGNEVATSPAAMKPPRKLKRPVFRSEFIAEEAVHSGDEVSEGSSPGEEEEDEEDREFLRELSETPMSDSYDQSQIYRDSLLSQAPPGFGRNNRERFDPQFRTGPVHKGAFGVRGGRFQRPVVTIPSSPRELGSEPDEYHLGSFVVDDDEEILYSNSP